MGYEYECPSTKLNPRVHEILTYHVIINALTLSTVLHIGYYTVARRYGFYVRVARTVSHE